MDQPEIKKPTVLLRQLAKNTKHYHIKIEHCAMSQLANWSTR